MSQKKIGVWFPAVRAGTGADFFTLCLAEALRKRDIRTEISWLPARAEYFPWSVTVPDCPDWASVVHTNSWLSQRFVPNNLPVVTTFHSSIYDPILAKYKNFLQALYHRLWVRRLERKSVRSANIVTAVSEYAATQAKKAFHCAQVETIYNWVDIEKFSPPDQREQHNPFRLLFVGNVSRRLKGADLLAPIMELLGSDYELRITGKLADIPVQGTLPLNIVELGYLRSKQEMVAAYQECDVFLFPSRLEGLSLSVLEAQSCGLPVVATNASSLPEAVGNNISGFLCPLDDVNAFADAVRHLRREQELWRGMTIAARSRVEKHFNESEALKKYIDIYSQLINK